MIESHRLPLPKEADEEAERTTCWSIRSSSSSMLRDEAIRRANHSAHGWCSIHHLLFQTLYSIQLFHSLKPVAVLEKTMTLAVSLLALQSRPTIS